MTVVLKVGAGRLLAELSDGNTMSFDKLLIATGEVIKPGKTLVITRGEAYVVKGDKTTHCSTMQQTLMTMHGKAEK